MIKTTLRISRTSHLHTCRWAIFTLLLCLLKTCLLSSVVFWRFLRWNKVIGTVSVWICAPLVGSIFEHVPNVWGCLDIWKFSYLPRKREIWEDWGVGKLQKNTQIPFYFQQSSPGKLRKPWGTKVKHSEGTPPPCWDGRLGSSDQYLSFCLVVCDSPSTMTRSAVLCLAVSAAIFGCGKNKELMQIFLTPRSIEAILFSIK